MSNKRVAYLGPAGTFSHEFALRHFGGVAEFISVEEPDADVAFDKIILEVVEGRATHAVLPFCNSGGSHIARTHRALGKYIGRIFIEGCFKEKIVLNFVTTESFQGLKTITSKEEVFKQCTNWLSQWQDVDKVGKKSTAAALIELVESPPAKQRFTGVICNTAAVTAYGGVIRDRSIEDPKNSTLFVVITSEKPDLNLNQILVCVTCPTAECYAQTRADLAKSGYPTVFSSLEGEFSDESPIFLEVSRQEESFDIEPILMVPHRALLGAFRTRQAISTCVTNFFTDEELDFYDDEL